MPSSSPARSRPARSPARPGQPVDQLVHLELGADVDAARRLVEQQHRGCRQQHLAEHDLLLVAAGQRADRLLERSATLMRRSSTAAARSCDLAVAVDERRRDAGGRSDDSDRLKATPCGSTRPKRLRSSVTSASPAASASRGVARPRVAGRRARTVARRARAPESRTGACSSSVRPAPISPPMPSTSPARTVERSRRAAADAAARGRDLQAAHREQLVARRRPACRG